MRAAALEARHRGGADQHGAGTGLQQEIQLPAGGIHVRQIDGASGVLAAVGEAVLFGDPQIQGMEQSLDGLRLVGEALLDHRGQGRQQDGGVDALLIKDLHVGGTAVKFGT